MTQSQIFLEFLYLMRVCGLRDRRSCRDWTREISMETQD
jgi:hypothetical protein